mmetsp:Transcript_4404/g.9313  ORF Transcript_4404/g.9313 Transcript_4404/m.9313 type:complete len:489 (-) Transcript_4404:323-1789(-)|eukprot:CAMPEP_0183319482 /NCGR_PEP_ID=MMETSP0160_2-20130417/63792_1 /TAXON_ID=2839 ORGANISM="Odontella Sinensis, Strain Grunow 1884" /NCGR_SAMPLE_ID=MMETSP0160_2 /ASSEMBLY_ACC=CAM_ASM_000250 /LENGTH=488 /DNA_ID=CAMNT_0025485967 /DNA_START=128 /DNA_END=1594 /DNA_ORIENTATION=-
MILLVALLSFAAHAQAISVSESLLRLYHLTDGKQWKKSNGWREAAEGTDRKSPVCSWYGVTCQGNISALDEETIIGLDLAENNLKGKVPEHLWSMPSLASVNLEGNLIHDAGFEGFESSESKAPINKVFLTDNKLTSLSGLESASSTLKELRIGSNHFKQFPEEIFQLKHLKTLQVSDIADMTGTLSTMIGNLLNLRDLEISYTALKGTIPTEVGLLEKLEFLDLHDNKFHGALPTELGNLVKLHTISMENRGEDTGGLTGPLPSFEDLSVLTNLYLDHNALTGTIPKDFLENSAVTKKDVSVYLSNNKLSGRIPRELERFEKLHLEVQGNRINEIPDELCQKNEWMLGQVADFGCDAILCPKGSFAESGRRESLDNPCTKCPHGEEDAPHLGSLDCDSKPSEAAGQSEGGGGSLFRFAELVIAFVVVFSMGLFVAAARRVKRMNMVMPTSHSDVFDDAFDSEGDSDIGLENVSLEEIGEPSPKGLYI